MSTHPRIRPARGLVERLWRALRNPAAGRRRARWCRSWGATGPQADLAVPPISLRSRPRRHRLQEAERRRGELEAGVRPRPASTHPRIRPVRGLVERLWRALRNPAAGRRRARWCRSWGATGPSRPRSPADISTLSSAPASSAGGGAAQRRAGGWCATSARKRPSPHPPCAGSGGASLESLAQSCRWETTGSLVSILGGNGTKPTSQSRRYLYALVRAGIVCRRRSGAEASWRLVCDLGPQAPVHRCLRPVLYDHNTGQSPTCGSNSKKREGLSQPEAARKLEGRTQTDDRTGGGRLGGARPDVGGSSDGAGLSDEGEGSEASQSVGDAALEELSGDKKARSSCHRLCWRAFLRGFFCELFWQGRLAFAEFVSVRSFPGSFPGIFFRERDCSAQRHILWFCRWRWRSFADTFSQQPGGASRRVGRTWTSSFSRCVFARLR